MIISSSLLPTRFNGFINVTDSNIYIVYTDTPDINLIKQYDYSIIKLQNAIGAMFRAFLIIASTQTELNSIVGEETRYRVTKNGTNEISNETLYANNTSIYNEKTVYYHSVLRSLGYDGNKCDPQNLAYPSPSISEAQRIAYCMIYEKRQSNVDIPVHWNDLETSFDITVI